MTETLRRLERAGLVARAAYAEAPPRVEYALTGLGRSLLEPIHAFGRWAEAHADEVLAAQERAEAAMNARRPGPSESGN